MEIQVIFKFIVLLNFNVFILGNSSVKDLVLNDLLISEIYSASNFPDTECQVGIVEFLPLTSGLKVRINVRGEHEAELRSTSGELIHAWSPKPFSWQQFNKLSTGAYVLAVSVDGGEWEAYPIFIKD